MCTRSRRDENNAGKYGKGSEPCVEAYQGCTVGKRWLSKLPEEKRLLNPSVAGRWQNGWPIPMDFATWRRKLFLSVHRKNQKDSKEVGCCIPHLLGRCDDGGKGGAAPL